ncbi:MAG TPA: hypothetical protein D7I03_00775, partial [Candidatus Poseidoniales archaeon]
MGFLRTLCGLVAVSAGIFYLTSASNLSDNGKWSLIGITFVATFGWVLLGGRGVKTVSKVTNQEEITVASEDVVDSEDEIISDSDIPSPVTSDDLDG